MKDELQAEYLGWKGLSITIQKPDGTTEALTDINTDSTGGTGRIYVPSVAGNCTIQAHFPHSGKMLQSMVAPTYSMTRLSALM